MSEPLFDVPEGVLAELVSEDAGYFLRGARLLEAGHSEWQTYEVWIRHASASFSASMAAS